MARPLLLAVLLALALPPLAGCGPAGEDTDVGPTEPAPGEPVTEPVRAAPTGGPALPPPPPVQGRPTNGPPPPAPPAPAPVFELPIRLVGTEPFWGGRIAKDAITISGADRPDMRFPYADPVVTGAGARFRTQSAGAFPLDVTLVRETCSDGMSDKRYPFEATVVVGKETLKGCAIREAEFGGER